MAKKRKKTDNLSDLIRALDEALQALPDSASWDAFRSVIEHHVEQIGLVAAGDGLSRAQVGKLVEPYLTYTARRLYRQTEDPEFPVAFDTMATEAMDVYLQAGFVRGQRLRRITGEAEADKLAGKWFERVWFKNQRGDYQLDQRAAAEAVIEEMRTACVDYGQRKQFYTYDEEHGYWKRSTALTIQRKAIQIAGPTCTESLSKGVTNMVAILTEVPDGEMGGSGTALNLHNTAFDLDTGRPFERGPLDRFTYVLPYDYDPQATCPLVDEMLNIYSLGDEAWIRCFWETAGFVLQAPYTYQKMFWWVGDGRNGKGTMQRVLLAMLGNELTKTGFQISDLSKNFFLNSVIGKRMALCGDAAVTLQNVSLLKQYTGGDRMSTDVKFSDYTGPIEITAKLILAINKHPLVSSHEAIKPLVRRIVWLPWEYRIGEGKEDPTIEPRMMQELPGVFNRAYDGLCRLRRQNGFTTVPRGERQLKRWSGQANLFQEWLAERVVADPEGQEWLIEIWKEYVAWMNTWGGRLWDADQYNVRNARQLSKELQDVFEVRSERGSYTYWNEVKKQNQRGTQVLLKGIRLIRDMSDPFREVADAPKMINEIPF